MAKAKTEFFAGMPFKEWDAMNWFDQAEHILNYSYTKLLRQGMRAYQTGSGCKYRVNHNNLVTNKCAVGILVPDNSYRQYWECNTIIDLVETGNDIYASRPLVNTRLHKVFIKHSGLLRAMQQAHDINVRDGEHFERDLAREFSRIASVFGIIHRKPFDLDKGTYY